jgi:V/A-type H+-transporting ATPase subunit E
LRVKEILRGEEFAGGLIMTTIEDKISLFSKIIYDKVNEEKEEKLGIFSIEAQKKLDMEREKIEELMRSLQIDVLKKSNIKANVIVAKERVSKQREVLLLKDKLVKDALEDVRHKLVEFVSFLEYKPYFISALKRTFEGLDSGNYYLIVLKRDYERFKDDIEVIRDEYPQRNVEILFSEVDFIGGLMLKDFEGMFKIDNSINSKLQDCKEIIGVRVMEVLA